MKRVRLTMSQALVQFLDNQYIECDGVESKFVSGIFGIFGHGCVVGVGQALEQGGHNLKFYQGKNEQNMALAAVAYAKQMPLFMILVGLIYLIEVLSVMIQVSYFKATHGKRIFKMAPIHHHFELCGWSETRVVAVFSVVTAIMCLIALLAL